MCVCVCVCRKIQIPGRFSPVKRILVPPEQKARCAPKTVWTIRKRYICLSLHGIQPRIIHTTLTRLLIIYPYAKKQVITTKYKNKTLSAVTKLLQGDPRNVRRKR